MKLIISALVNADGILIPVTKEIPFGDGVSYLNVSELRELLAKHLDEFEGVVCSYSAKLVF